MTQPPVTLQPGDQVHTNPDGTSFVTNPIHPQYGEHPGTTATGWSAAGGIGYNITQAVHDVPNADEMKVIVESLRARGHQNVIASANHGVPSEWLVNYDTFPLLSTTEFTRGQQSKMGPYATSLLDVRARGDLSYFNAAENA